MNLNEYDIVNENFNNGTWVDPMYKRLYSTIIKYKPFSSFLKKYNNVTKQNEYYLLMMDNIHPNMQCSGVKRKDGIVKIDIPIWNNTSLINITTKTNVFIEQVDEQDDCDIYYLDI